MTHATTLDRTCRSVDASGLDRRPLRASTNSTRNSSTLAALGMPRSADRGRRRAAATSPSHHTDRVRSSFATRPSANSRRPHRPRAAPVAKDLVDRTHAADRRPPPRPAGRLRARARRPHRAEHRADPDRRRPPDVDVVAFEPHVPHRDGVPPAPPRYLLLLCLRGDPSAHTTLASVHDIMDRLPDRRGRRRCSNRASGPRSTPASSTDAPTNSARARPLVTGTRDEPTFIFDADLTVGIDDVAEDVLVADPFDDRRGRDLRRARTRRPARRRQQRRRPRSVAVHGPLRRHRPLAAAFVRGRRSRTERRRTRRSSDHHRSSVVADDHPIRSLTPETDGGQPSRSFDRTISVSGALSGRFDFTRTVTTSIAASLSGPHSRFVGLDVAKEHHTGQPDVVRCLDESFRRCELVGRRPLLERDLDVADRRELREVRDGFDGVVPGMPGDSVRGTESDRCGPDQVDRPAHLAAADAQHDVVADRVAILEQRPRPGRGRP